MTIDPLCIAQSIAIIAVLVIQVSKIALHAWRDYLERKKYEEFREKYEKMIDEWVMSKRKEGK